MAEGLQMLLGQQLCWCHQGDLVAGLDGVDTGHGGDQGFAGTHVTLHQSQHGRWFPHVSQNLPNNPLLGAGGLKRQGLEEGSNQAAVPLYRQSGAGFLLGAKRLQGEVVCDKLLQCQPELGWVLPVAHAVNRCARGWPMQVADGLGQVEIGFNNAFEEVLRSSLAQYVKGLLGKLAPQPLPQALYGRVNGCQRLLQQGVGSVQSVLRVHHFDTATRQAGLPEQGD